MEDGTNEYSTKKNLTDLTKIDLKSEFLRSATEILGPRCGEPPAKNSKTGVSVSSYRGTPNVIIHFYRWDVP